MVDLIVRSFLGQWGSNLLDFYLQNSLIVNGIIVGLALILWLKKRS